MQRYAEFNTDKKLGLSGEQIFEERFLKPLVSKGYDYRDVTNDPQYRRADIDFIWPKWKNGTFEVKNNYKDDGYLFIEEDHNVDAQFGPLKKGWWYHTQAQFIAFVSRTTGTIVVLTIDKDTKAIYEEVKGQYELRTNQISINRFNPDPRTNRWQSTFRRIPISVFMGKYKIIQ